jgi:hypothetical protein
MCSEVQEVNFTTLVYSVLLKVGESVLKMVETSWKNSLIIAKYVWLIHINFIVIAVTFSEKILSRYFCTTPNAFLSFLPRKPFSSYSDKTRRRDELQKRPRSYDSISCISYRESLKAIHANICTYEMKTMPFVQNRTLYEKRKHFR